MPKLTVSVDANYYRLAADMRSAVRKTVHKPEKRATTRTLFLTGALTLALIGGTAFGLLR